MKCSRKRRRTRRKHRMGRTGPLLAGMSVVGRPDGAPHTFPSLPTTTRTHPAGPTPLTVPARCPGTTETGHGTRKETGRRMAARRGTETETETETATEKESENETTTGTENVIERENENEIETTKENETGTTNENERETTRGSEIETTTEKEIETTRGTGTVTGRESVTGTGSMGNRAVGNL